MQSFHLYKTIFSLFCFPIIMAYIVNIVSAIKKMTSKERRGFTYKNYHSRIEFTKESSYYSIKRQKKRLTIPHNQIN